MKTLAIVVAILSSSLSNNTYAKGNLDIDQELGQVIKFEENEDLDQKNEIDFVKISFKINELGKIEILELNYSNKLVKDKLIKRLKEIKVKDEYNSSEVYYYNFMFDKH